MARCLTRGKGRKNHVKSENVCLVDVYERRLLLLLLLFGRSRNYYGSAKRSCFLHFFFFSPFQSLRTILPGSDPVPPSCGSRAPIISSGRRIRILHIIKPRTSEYVSFAGVCRLIVFCPYGREWNRLGRRVNIRAKPRPIVYRKRNLRGNRKIIERIKKNRFDRVKSPAIVCRHNESRASVTGVCRILDS